MGMVWHDVLGKLETPPAVIEVKDLRQEVSIRRGNSYVPRVNDSERLLMESTIGVPIHPSIHSGGRKRSKSCWL